MDFQPWQVAKLRSRLAAYRLNSGHDTRAKFWREVADDLSCSEAVISLLDEEGDLLMSKESLRKFIEGESKKAGKKPTTPDDLFLKAICDFLVETGYLLAVEMKKKRDEGFGAAIALQGHLGNLRGELTEERCGDFYSAQQLDGSILERLLHVELSPDKSFHLVWEVRSRFTTGTGLAFENWRDNERRYNLTSRDYLTGWAIVDTGGTMLLLMKHEDERRRKNYCYATSRLQADFDTDGVHLVPFESGNGFTVANAQALGRGIDFGAATLADIQKVNFKMGRD